MRTKLEILEQYTKDGLGSASDGALSMLAVLNLLEILIDIRDIHDGIFGFLATYYKDVIK